MPVPIQFVASLRGEAREVINNIRMRFELLDVGLCAPYCEIKRVGMVAAERVLPRGAGLPAIPGTESRIRIHTSWNPYTRILRGQGSYKTDPLCTVGLALPLSEERHFLHHLLVHCSNFPQHAQVSE